MELIRDKRCAPYYLKSSDGMSFLTLRYMRIKICIGVHPNSRAVKFDIRNKISKQFGQFWSFLTRQ